MIAAIKSKAMIYLNQKINISFIGCINLFPSHFHTFFTVIVVIFKLRAKLIIIALISSIPWGSNITILLINQTLSIANSNTIHTINILLNIIKNDHIDNKNQKNNIRKLIVVLFIKIFHINIIALSVLIFFICCATCSNNNFLVSSCIGVIEYKNIINTIIAIDINK